MKEMPNFGRAIALAGGLGALTLLVPTTAEADITVSCTAVPTPVASDSCTFVGDGTSIGAGWVATTTGSWSIKPAGGAVVAGSAQGSDPAGEYTFESGVTYVLTAGKGVGQVSGGNGE